MGWGSESSDDPNDNPAPSLWENIVVQNDVETWGLKAAIRLVEEGEIDVSGICNHCLIVGDRRICDECLENPQTFLSNVPNSDNLKGNFFVLRKIFHHFLCYIVSKNVADVHFIHIFDR